MTNDFFSKGGESGSLVWIFLDSIVTIVTIVGFYLPTGDIATTYTGPRYALIMLTFSLINQAIC